MKHIVRLLLLFVLAATRSGHAQNPDTVVFTEAGHHYFDTTISFLNYSAYTPLFDRLGRDYLYVTTKELGLITYDISLPSNPTPVDTIAVNQFGNLKPTDVVQNGNYLYVSLGDFQGFIPQRAGMAIINVQNPLVPVITDQWDSTAYNQGAAAILYDNGYAYLGAMERGVLILDVSNTGNIVFKSQFIPDPLFGNPANAPNARGLAIRNDTLYVAYDAGGLRILDVTNKTNVTEVGKYRSPAIVSAAYPYYNNVSLVGNYAYVAVDFCGIDVVDVSDPVNMQSSGWLNPWSCLKDTVQNTNTWSGSDGHTNQLRFVPGDSIFFVSGGDTEVLAVDGDNPAQPTVAGSFGAVNDSIFGSWGIDYFNNQVAVTLIRYPIHGPFTPFFTRQGGIRILSWTHPLGEKENVSKPVAFNVYPNPVTEQLRLQSDYTGAVRVQCFDLSGKAVTASHSFANANNAAVDVRGLAAGTYLLKLVADESVCWKKVVIKR